MAGRGRTLTEKVKRDISQEVSHCKVIAKEIRGGTIKISQLRAKCNDMIKSLNNIQDANGYREETDEK